MLQRFDKNIHCIFIAIKQDFYFQNFIFCVIENKINFLFFQKLVL